MAVSTEDVLDLVRAYAGVIAENRDYLVQLDAAIGDADHGENMDRGMKAALAKLDGESPGTPADVLKSVATSLITKVGGAAGPLYGTAFLRAATSVQGKEALEPADVVTAMTAARDGIVARGKAEPQDKTMVDAWTPAVDAAAAAASDGGGVRAVLEAAADAAEQGMRDTIPWVARKGRASYLGERSAGHQDPGATSTALLIRAAADLAAQGA